MYLKTRVNQAITIYREDGTTNSNITSTLNALSRGNETIAKRFGGFIECEEVRPLRLQYVKLLDVVGVSHDELSNWFEIPRDHYVVGAYKNGMFYCCLFKGRVKYFSLSQEQLDSFKTIYQTNNVYSLSPRND